MLSGPGLVEELEYGEGGGLGTYRRRAVNWRPSAATPDGGDSGWETPLT
jgi:hypothetical protein